MAGILTAADKDKNLDTAEEQRDRADNASKNFAGFNVMWKAVTGNSTTRNNVMYQRMVNGRPTAPLTKEAWAMEGKMKELAPWGTALESMGMGRDSFDDPQKAINYMNKWKRRFNTVGELQQWVAAADDFKRRRPGSKMNRAQAAYELKSKWKLPSNYTAHADAVEEVFKYRQEVRDVFGDDLYQYEAGVEGFSGIGEEVTNFSDIQKLYQQYDITTQLTRADVADILGEHGSAIGYGNWLAGGESSSAWAAKFASLSGYGYDTPTAQVMQEMYRDQGAQTFDQNMNRVFQEFTARKAGLTKATVGGSASSETGANPDLGKWWE